MTREYIGSSGTLVIETGTSSYIGSSGAIMLETTDAGGVTASVAYTEEDDTVAVSIDVAVAAVELDIGYTEENDTVSALVFVDTATPTVEVDVGYTEESDTVLAGVNVAGVLTTRKFHNNTGLAGVRASVTDVALNIYNETTGALVARLTGLTTTAEGRLVVSHASLAIGTSYAYEADFTAAGFGRRLPVAAAA